MSEKLDAKVLEYLNEEFKTEGGAMGVLAWKVDQLDKTVEFLKESLDRILKIMEAKDGKEVKDE